MNLSVREAPIPAQFGTSRGSGVSAEDLLNLIRRNIWLIVVVCTATLALTASYLSVQPDVYRAQAAMELTNSEVRLSQIDSQFESYELNSARIATVMDVLRSRNFAQTVATNLELFDNRTFLPKPSGPVKPNKDTWKRMVVDHLLASYSVHRAGESLVITLQAEAHDPQMAARLANGLVQNFVETSVRDQAMVIDSSVAHLRSQVESLGEELSLKEVELAELIRETALDDAELPLRLLRERNHLSSVLANLESDGQGNGAEAGQIRDQIERIETQLTERTRNDLMLNRSQRYIDLLSTRYQTAIERLNTLEPRKEIVQADARQISKAEVPVRPSAPNRSATMAVVFAASLVLAFLLAMLRAALNRTVEDAAHATRVSGQPNLGTVPRIRRRGMLTRNHDPIWFLRNFPRSGFAESLRSILTFWSSQHRDSGVPKLMMVTSGVQSEGKSTVSTALAASTALDGLRVLLLDFDSQPGGASRILKVPEGVVPATALADGSVSWRDAIQPAPGFDRLDVLDIPPDTSWTSRLISAFAQRVIPEMREHYDLIVLDTPPALAIADAVRFGALADEAIVVVRAGQTSERALLTTMQKLERAGINVGGTVVNDVEPRHFRQHHNGVGYDYA